VDARAGLGLVEYMKNLPLPGFDPRPSSQSLYLLSYRDSPQYRDWNQLNFFGIANTIPDTFFRQKKIAFTLSDLCAYLGPHGTAGVMDLHLYPLHLSPVARDPTRFLPTGRRVQKICLQTYVRTLLLIALEYLGYKVNCYAF
jgi:hypothetical protein